MKIKKTSILIVVILFSLLPATCGKSPEGGSILFTANGESFAREKFTDATGWAISFSEIIVHLQSPTAYHPDGSVRPVVLSGMHRVNLATPGTSMAVLGEKTNVPPGNYQALRFTLTGPRKSSQFLPSIILKGKAEKKGRKVAFTLRFYSRLSCDGTEGYVGEEVKGLLSPGKKTTVEMTFHIDHIFGDSSAPASSHVNQGAVGFEYFYRIGKRKSQIDLDQREMKTDADYPKLKTALLNLPHLGEGHCDCSFIEEK